ncbi:MULTISPECIES: extracellular solute-binding protein [unclassified Mesorhizobium]|uniref:ABC transporter substrate-binding protein n=1 Tax=unclassified Mesorhizobium TaxID=325217 RepID=UPI00112D552F|nr:MULTISPECIES: extracellular solute-binding protein [unclassified Mesorhizobium]MBZ9984571.1 extracellular solute-binding protein [Mesorhizobium sp. BR-1-1-8]TPL28881.1 extracellular solute-binding protein [Mesorhizobium sp. B2-4-8]TPL63770.1 extracellular solute-binding protein [Mesorhizobium sp. B2-4-1]
MTKLRGLAWDHRRCWGPLDASIESYCAAHPGLEIQWDRRSLYEFGEGALGPVLGTYDLVVFDHPFIGDIAQDELMVPFDAYLSAEQMHFFERDSVGASWRSYQKNSRQWALPIDAACQVASYRPDLLERYGPVPSTHQDVLELGRRARSDGKWLGLPFVPTDAMCLLLTLGRPQEDGEQFIAKEMVEQAIAQLRELVALSHPDSSKWNPIRCYDHMIAHDDVVYVPFAFGYVNYASKPDRPHLRFADVPTPQAAGALLGGAGIGVSAQSKHKQAAIDYALFLCSPEYQRGDYVKSGGQPGSLAAWKDAGVNGLSGDFFGSTLRTIASSYLRPTHPGFIAFFRECAPHAAAAIAGDMSATELAGHVNSLYRETRQVQPERSVA